MDNGLANIIELIKKTGDRVIVVDAHGDPQYVILNLAEYQRLVTGSTALGTLTEEQLMDKINRDIGSWKADQDSQKNKQKGPGRSISRAGGGKNVDKPMSDKENFSGEEMLNQAKNQNFEDEYAFEPIE